MKDFMWGFLYPLKCLSEFKKHPKIILYSIFPLIINSIIYITVFISLYSKIISTSGYYTGASSEDSGFLQETFYIVILISSFFILLIVSYFALIVIGSIITAPFNENISLIIEESSTSLKSAYNPGIFRDLFLSVKAEIFKLSFYLFFISIFFLIGFIPVIGTVVSFTLGLLFSFFFNALDFLDYPMTRRYFTLRKKIKVTYSKFMLSMGFGCMSFILMFLPIINVLTKPLCVVSGTALFFQRKYIHQNDKKS